MDGKTASLFAGRKSHSGSQNPSASSTHKGRTHHTPARKTGPRHIPWPIIGMVAGILLVLVIASFGFAASQEEHNAFCASCHTQPETTYYERDQAGKVVDLSVFHNTKDVKCIDCHSGEGLTGRVAAILTGAHNAFAYFTHTATQPAPLLWPIGDGNCLKCHGNVAESTDFSNHFHVYLSRWQAQDPNAAGCVSCHSSHTLDGDPTAAYLSQARTEQVCSNCHNSLVVQ